MSARVAQGTMALLKTCTNHISNTDLTYLAASAIELLAGHFAYL